MRAHGRTADHLHTRDTTFVDVSRAPLEKIEAYKASNARGLETVGGSYYFLDETALGRQEDWEEPKGRAADARGAVPDFSS